MDGQSGLGSMINQDPSGPFGSYRKSRNRRVTIILSIVAFLTALLFIDLLTGPASLSFGDVFSTLLNPDNAEPSVRTIIWTFRLPSALMALAVGASLGIAGAEMQTILNNPLASPYTLGVSAAASFGAAIAFVFGAGLPAVPIDYLVPGTAFVMATICCLAIYSIGRLRGGTAETIIVGGVALHFIFSSGVALLQYLASDDTLHAIVFWIFGTLQGANWEKLAIISIVLILSSFFLLSNAWQLTALRLGESHARSLGINVRALRLRTLVSISLLTATAVCFTGAIGFVGLVAPHFGRLLVGEDQRFFLPTSALCGAILVSAADIICRVSVPGTIFPIGIATAVIGAPFFAGMAVFARRKFW